MTREEAIKILEQLKRIDDMILESPKNFFAINMAIKSLEQEPKTGRWKRIGYDLYECSICGQDVMTSDICAYRYCHCCGAKMFEPQESEDK